MSIFTTNAYAVAAAISQIYVTEEAGTANNPQILKYAEEAGFKEYTADDISWCSLFLNWVAKRIGKDGTHSLRARSWLTYGSQVIAEPSVGDIAILWRGSPDAITGHVGLFLNEIKKADGKICIRILGGNQSDQVKISEFPKEQLLEFRRWI